MRSVLALLLFCSCARPAVSPSSWSLDAVTFGGAGFRAVELDGYGTAVGPHWPLRSRAPTIAEDVPEEYRLRGPPVAYIAGTVPEADVSAHVPRSWSGSTVRIEARGAGWLLSGTGDVVDGVLRARVVADHPVGAVLAQEPQWRLRWRAFRGSESAELGSSSAQLYVLLGEPRGPLLHTPLHIAAVHAAGRSDAREVIDAVWSAFARGEVRRARDGRPLRYYGEYLDGAPAELRRMLVSGTGQCVAWSHLLYATLSAHGIAAAIVGVEPPDAAGQLFIAPWRFVDGRRFIETGANGVAETRAAGDDVAVLQPGHGVPHSRIWAPEPLPIARLHGDDTLAYLVGRNGLAETFVDTALALPLLARGFGLEQQRAYELEAEARVVAGGDDVIVTEDGVRFLLTGANGVLETERQPGMREGRARGTDWDPVMGEGSTARRVQGSLPRAWPLSELGGDDREWGWRLTTGADGVSQTRGARPGQGLAHAVAIAAGANGVIDSAPGGDDRLLDLSEYLADAPDGYMYVTPFTLWPEPGAGAQQNPWPPTEYPSHVIVRIGDAYYDPSFRRGPFASPLEWERALLAGVGVRLVRSGGPLRLDERVVYAVRRSDGSTPLARFTPRPPPY